MLSPDRKLAQVAPGRGVHMPAKGVTAEEAAERTEARNQREPTRRP